MIRENARILRYSAMSAFADLRAIYTWWTWSVAWLSRILCQVAFFALIGRLLGSPERTHYLVIGNAVYMVAVVTMLVCASTAWERQIGTLPLLVAAPAPPFPVFVGRSVQWLLDGTACAVISLFVLGWLFGVPLPMPRTLLAIPLIAVVGVTTYCFGLVLAGLVLRKPEVRNLVGNMGTMALMLLCGVQVPVTFWPAPVAHLSSFLPMTHGLAGIRSLLDGRPLGQLLGQVVVEICVGGFWLCLAGLTFWHFAESGRRDGSIEFSE